MKSTQAELKLSFQGLVTAMGNLQSPKGGMRRAQNVNFPAPGIAEKRKGIERLAQLFGGPTWEAIDAGVPALEDGSIFFQTGTATRPTGLFIGNGVTPSTLLTLPDTKSVEGSNVNQYRTRMAQLNDTYFFTGLNGVARLPFNSTVPFYAGAPKSPGFDTDRATGVLVPVAGGFLADGFSVAYRCVWGFHPNGDKNQEVVGAPSGRSIVSNVAGVPGYVVATPANVIRRVTVPKAVRCSGAAVTEVITTDFFVRIYRSFQVPFASSIPSDEMQLCVEYQVTATDIANGYIEFSAAGVPGFPDATPESVLGAYLYTNSISGGDITTAALTSGRQTAGIAAQNDIPPQANEVAQFAKCLFYGNIFLPARLVESLIALPAVGEQILIDSVVYTATNVFPPPTPTDFFITTTGTVSQNLQATALALVEAINGNPTNTSVVATYSGNDSSPGTVGQFILEARLAAASFSFQVGSAAMGRKLLPNVVYPDGLVIDPAPRTNGLGISKPSQGDAVPPANITGVGPSSCTILAMVPLREALFIFTDVGLYWLRGNSPSDFTIDLLDPTFRLWGARGVVSVGDALYAWGREGIAEITSGGVKHLDVPIRNLVQKIEKDLGQDAVRHGPKIADYFAIGYRVDRRVLFFYPSAADTMNCQEALVWNIATQTWSTFANAEDSGKSAGAVRTVDELAFYGSWNAISSDSRLFLDRNTGTQADYADTSDSGSLKAIDSVMRWNPDAPNAAVLNRWQELTVLLSPSTVNPALATLPTSLNSTFETEAAGPSVCSIPILSIQVRQDVPRDAAIGVRMTVTVQHVIPSQYFAICGAVLLYTPMSTGTTK